jgi:biopolymer transport protein ExbD
MAEESKKVLTAEEMERLEELQRYAEKKKGKKKRRETFTRELSITSLMDALTIILVFMLMNYAVNPTNITSSDDLKLAPSVENTQPQEAIPVAITKRAILVDNEPVAEVKDGKVSVADKTAEGTAFIKSLADKLNLVKDQQKALAEAQGKNFEGNLLLVVDDQAPYSLLREVMLTAGKVGFGKFSFIVMSTTAG